MRMQFATGPDPTDLLMLPWSTPLADWPKEKLVSLPRGISRHVVRFVRIGGIVYAIKEISQGLADHEYELLRELAKVGIPVVQAVGVVANRMTPEGEPLDAALVTKHLRFSLPYRALFSRRMDPDLETKLLDALAELLVRLHLVGFAWKDCSLSNTLFRRDAGALAAYLVDAETGEMREQTVQGAARPGPGHRRDERRRRTARPADVRPAAGIDRPAGNRRLGARAVRAALGPAHRTADHGR